MIPFSLVLMSNDVVLDLIILLKSQKIMEINANSSQNAYEMYNSINFCNLGKKIEKTIEKYCF